MKEELAAKRATEKKALREAEDAELAQLDQKGIRKGQGMCNYIPAIAALIEPLLPSLCFCTCTDNILSVLTWTVTTQHHINQYQVCAPLKPDFVISPCSSLCSSTMA